LLKLASIVGLIAPFESQKNLNPNDFLETCCDLWNHGFDRALIDRPLLRFARQMVPAAITSTLHVFAIAHHSMLSS
jgi:hypothetical protein